jgi:hypothetical protein
VPRTSSLLLAAFLSFSTAAAAPAERPPALWLEVSGATDIHRGELYASWDASPALEISLEGSPGPVLLQAGLEVSDVSGRRPEIPGFLAPTTFLGAGIERPLFGGVLGSATLRTGLYWMYLEESETFGEGTRETELYFATRERLRLPLDPRWSVGLVGQYRVVLTRDRLHQVYVGFAVARGFDTPGWLRAFLE